MKRDEKKMERIAVILQNDLIDIKKDWIENHNQEVTVNRLATLNMAIQLADYQLDMRSDEVAYLDDQIEKFIECHGPNFTKYKEEGLRDVINFKL